MRRKLFVLYLFVLSILNATAQEHWNDKYIGSVTYDTAFGDIAESFNGVDVKVEYKKYLKKGLFIAPSVNLYYEDYEASGVLGGGTIPNYSDSEYSYKLGAGIAAMVGYTIPVYSTSSWDLYSGPQFRHHIIVRENFHGLISDNRGDDKFSRWVALRWNFGIGFNIQRVSLRVEYALGLTPYGTNSHSSNVADHLSLGIGYRF